MAVRAVVFDVDGVLVRAGVFGEILEAEHGLDRAATADFFQGPFKECVVGRADLKKELEPFLRAWRWPGSVDECLRIWFEADAALNGEVLDVAKTLRTNGLRCYIASTQELHRAAYLEDALGLGDLFDESFFSCRVGVSKPDAAFFHHVTDSIGIPPAETLLLDDHEPNVIGARSAGWRGELYTWGDDILSLISRHDISIADA